jgi:transcriptional antiterminator RfaH
MPLLPQEPSLYPADLFQAAALSSEPQSAWSALYVKARAEKSLARKLLAQRIGFFLPLYEQTSRAAGRVRRSYLPLFPGYLFLHAGEEARVRVLETNLVSRFLPVADQEQLYRDLARVHRLIEAGEPLTPVERLQPGTLVEITEGVLAGTQGTVLRAGRQLQFVIEVRFLQRGVAMEVDGRMIRPVREALRVGT